MTNIEKKQALRLIEKFWLIFIIGFSILHLVRDIQQDLGINNMLTGILASPGPPKTSVVIYWTVFNTYVFELSLFIISVYCLKRNEFGKLGKVTVMIAITSLLLWLVYYFILK